MRKRDRNNGRAGMHREDKHRVQAYYTANEKALFVLVAKCEGMTITDTIKASVYDRARALGILDANNQVTKQYKAMLNIETSIIEQTERN